MSDSVRMLFRATIFAALFALATPASALMIQISDTADFSGTVVSVDDTDGDGVVNINEGLGSWIVNVVTGLSSPAIGSEYVDKIDLNSVNVSGGSGTIYIRLTDTDFSRSDAQYIAAVGGTTNGEVSFQSYADSTNTAFGQGTLLADSGWIAGPSFSDVESGGLSMTSLYSLSIYAAISHTAAGQVSSFDYYVSVPEPGTLGLLGMGLLGLGFGARRKQQGA